MTNPTSIEQLDQDYWNHMNGWEVPRRTKFFCVGCYEIHEGVIARRYGQDIVYRDIDNALYRVEYRFGKYDCLMPDEKAAAVADS